METGRHQWVPKRVCTHENGETDCERHVAFRTCACPGGPLPYAGPTLVSVTPTGLSAMRNRLTGVLSVKGSNFGVTVIDSVGPVLIAHTVHVGRARCQSLVWVSDTGMCCRPRARVCNVLQCSARVC